MHVCKNAITDVVCESIDFHFYDDPKNPTRTQGNRRGKARCKVPISQHYHKTTQKLSDIPLIH